MPAAITDSVLGHRAKYDHLASNLPPDQVGPQFVGGGDAVLTGYTELEIIRKFRRLPGAAVVDIGCGIGRLTRYMLDEHLFGYLGLDIIPEILQEAEKVANGQPRFKFSIVENCKLPSADAWADVVCGFSLITHLLDEEIFEYFSEARRVLRPGGVAVFSFIDFENDTHLSSFVAHARQHRHGHGDLLKYTTKSILQRFARCAGFSSTTFIDEGRTVVEASYRTKLIDGRDIPSELHLGQSICAMMV